VNYWLLKTEPFAYSFADLMRDERTVWDGVGNNQALLFLRRISKGDRAFIYHTGKDKHIAGVAEVVRGPYPDPELCDEKRAVFDVQAVQSVPKPVTLAAIKGRAAFAGFHLVRSPRLSVMPVTAAQWKTLCGMGGVKP